MPHAWYCGNVVIDLITLTLAEGFAAMSSFGDRGMRRVCFPLQPTQSSNGGLETLLGILSQKNPLTLCELMEPESK